MPFLTEKKDFIERMILRSFTEKTNEIDGI